MLYLGVVCILHYNDANFKFTVTTLCCTVFFGIEITVPVMLISFNKNYWIFFLIQNFFTEITHFCMF